MTRNILRSSRFVLATLLAAVLLQACGKKQEKAVQEDLAVAPIGTQCRPSTTAPSPTAPDLDCPAPPNTFDVSAFFVAGAPLATTQQAGPTFDAWAWESFAAYNWPAKVDSSQPSGYVRGVPDVTTPGASFLSATGGQVAVWETFKEKREVFNNDVQNGQWQQITYSTEQSVGTPGGVPACAPPDQTKFDALPTGRKRILHASKLAPAIATGPNQLDETAEVASPAQESQNALCAGYTGSALNTCQSAFTVPPSPPGADGSTAFSPTISNPRPAVGPRVIDTASNLIYYEVRVNYDYFNYVLTKGLNFANPVPARTPPINPPYSPPYNLPWRTSAQNTPINNPGPPIKPAMNRGPSTLNYDAGTTADSYVSAPTTPPAVGSVQVKSAWKILTGSDTPANYHTTDAVFFNTTASGTPCFSVTTFGLIGLHIIQRVHMGDKNAPYADPIGGTFIFATWEHNTIANGGGYSYVSFLTKGGMEQSNPVPYPNYPTVPAIPITRQQPYPLASTQGVTEKVYHQLGASSVWRNYRLIGTQFYPNVDATTSPQNFNQPYYLANLVVETNNGLQNFQGLPPNVAPVSQYSGFTPTTVPPATQLQYNPNVPNVSLNGVAHNMGGCMGCHGVAQLLGANFSFVLLDGQRGAGIDTRTDVAIPPNLPP